MSTLSYLPDGIINFKDQEYKAKKKHINYRIRKSLFDIEDTSKPIPDTSKTDIKNKDDEIDPTLYTTSDPAKRLLPETNINFLMNALSDKDTYGFAKHLFENHKFDMSHKSKKGYTAIMFASGDDTNLKMIEKMIENGADISTVSSDRMTAYTTAAKCAALDIVKLYFTKYANKINPNHIDQYGKTFFMYLCINSNKRNKTPYYANMWLDIAKAFLRDFPDYDMEIADSSGVNGIMYILNNDVGELLNEIDVSKITDDTIKQTDTGGYNMLMFAIQSQELQVVKIILEKNIIDINHQSNNGTTALMISSELDNMSSCKILLEKSPNLYLQNKEGQTALMIAIMKKHDKTALTILQYYDENPIHYDILDEGGRNALIYAVIYEYPNVVEALIKHSNVNIIDKYNNTPLSYNIDKDNDQIYKILVSKLEDNLYDFMSVYNNLKVQYKRNAPYSYQGYKNNTTSNYYGNGHHYGYHY